MAWVVSFLFLYYFFLIIIFLLHFCIIYHFAYTQLGVVQGSKPTVMVMVAHGMNGMQCICILQQQPTICHILSIFWYSLQKNRCNPCRTRWQLTPITHYNNKNTNKRKEAGRVCAKWLNNAVKRLTYIKVLILEQLKPIGSAFNRISYEQWNYLPSIIIINKTNR